MFIFSLFTTLYIPCLATIIALKRELGNKDAILLTLGEVLLAVGLVGILNQILIHFIG
jgi:Fe2+ transport system protein B